MSIRVMSQVWTLDLAASEKLVLLALADCANDEGHCWPSMKTLAEKCSKTDRTVQASIKALVDAGHLTRREVPGKGCNYTVHPRNPFAPEKSSPPKKTTQTPENSSDKPSRTVMSKKDKPSLTKRAPFPPPVGVSDQVWRDFLASPARRKAGMSDTAYAGICRNLDNLAEHGFPPGEMIALAVERGWRTVKLEWVLNDGRHANPMAGNRRDGPGEARILTAGARFVARGAGGPPP